MTRAAIIILLFIAAFKFEVDGAEKQPFEAFIGKWEQSANTNADDYLAAIEVSAIVRAFAFFTPRLYISKDGAKRLKMTIEAGKKSQTRRVVFGEDVDDVAIKNTVDNRKAKTTHTMEGQQWHTEEIWISSVTGKMKTARYERELIDNDTMLIKIFVDEVKATQMTFKRMP